MKRPLTFFGLAALAAYAARPAGQQNIGTKQRTDRPDFKAAPWPNAPTEADDSECPVCNATYAKFRAPGISYASAASYLRDHGGGVGQGWDLNQKAHHGDVLKLLGVWKTNAWRERHGYCLFPEDRPERPLRQHDPSSWGIPSANPSSDLICFSTRRRASVCFFGTRRKVTGRGKPPHGGADCRVPRTGKYSANCKKR